ncbi:hypothetical protein [Sedimentitalea todarodis]|uniref:Uncharacterized protein n=1 Tax=Sedimentitalea todarodis TaxID=1631240 RepID=A0ABU3VHV8_9RHOB|nr:hypothetical protein [Sedimentitalea todarodis]MDU9005757.1 hypothetical protein [Sedimentitalea todarodis]
MTYHTRQNFQTAASPDEIERLLFHMPAVASSAENDWAAGFAKSVCRQSYRKGWKPSPKQLSVMRGLVSDLFIHASNEGGDFDLIES